MAGLEDLQEKQRVRWARAERYARGVADNGMGEALRVYYTRYFPAGVLIVVALVIGFSALLPEPIDWPFTFGLGFLLIAGFSTVGGLLYNSKRLAPLADLGPTTTMGALFPLDRDERKHVLRQISGKAPLVPDHVRIARSTAVHLRKQNATQLLVSPAWTVMLVSLGDSTPWLFVPILALFVSLYVWAVADFRRKGRFLARTEGMVPADGK